MKPTSTRDTPPPGQLNSSPDSTEAEVKALFDPRPDTSITSPVQHTHPVAVVFLRIAAAFSEAAAWVRQIFLGNSRSSPPLMAVSAPRQLPSNGTETRQPEIANRDAEQLHAVAKAAVATDSGRPAGAPLPGSPSSQADKNREAFDTYVRLAKEEAMPPGAAFIPQNFEKGTVAHANAMVDQVLDAKKKAEAEGGEFYLPSEQQEKLKIAAGVLEQQKDNLIAKAKAAEARGAGHVPTNTAQQFSSFMAWREWKNTPDRLPANEDFSIDAALAYAHEVLAQNASKAEAMQPEIKALLNDAIVLIAKADEFRDKYENARLIANVLASAEAARPAPKEFSSARTGTLARPAEQTAVDSQGGRGMPPPPPPPRRQSNPHASAVLPETPQPATPPPAAPAPRKQNLAHLVGRLPNWSGKQLAIIASAAFPLNSDQVSRAIQGLRSIDWAAGAAPVATPSGKATDETQRLMNYARQQQAANDDRAGTLEYASMLLKYLKPEQLNGPEFGPLLDLHAQRKELSARVDAELQALRPPRIAPANRKN